MDVRTIGARLELDERLDAAVGPLRDVAAAIPGDVKRFLQGERLGHPLHPMLTDLPIGFWTSAWVLDLVGGRRSARVATALVGFGVVSAIPTAAAGLADWSEMSRAKQRVGSVHAAANITATALYGLSFAARCRGERYRGVVLGMAGAAAATIGGYLGGHLVFGTTAGEAEDLPDRPGEGAVADEGLVVLDEPVVDGRVG